MHTKHKSSILRKKRLNSIEDKNHKEINMQFTMPQQNPRELNWKTKITNYIYSLLSIKSLVSIDNHDDKNDLHKIKPKQKSREIRHCLGILNHNHIA